MMPVAHVSHHSHGRTRFRFPQNRGDHSLFHKIMEELKNLKSVTGLKYNEVSASLLVLHECSLADLERFARRRQLFKIKHKSKTPTVSDRMHRQVKGSIERTGTSLMKATDGQVDMVAVAFAAMISAGIVQMSKGYIFPPATTLFSRAVKMLLQAKRSQLSAELSNLPPDQARTLAELALTYEALQ